MLLEQMKTIKDKVLLLLEKNPHLRDSDFKLIANYYFFEVGHEKMAKLSAMEFLDLFAKGSLSHSESIRRVRQKIQEDNPHLRGESYKIRKSDSKVVRNNIKDL